MSPESKFSQELDGITEKVIGCGFKVSTELGTGFIEKVYENALVHELRKAGLEVKQQFPIKVKYDGEVVGEFVCDLLVNDSVMVELKAVKLLEAIHLAQCLNYLKATGLKVCLLMNFGRKKLQLQRVVNHF